MKRRLRVPLGALAIGVRALEKETATYVTRVHRLREGDVFTAFDPELAIEADARLIAIGARSVEVQIEAIRAAAVTAPRPVTLVQSLGKGDKVDAIVRDATELGVTRIVPVIAERSVVRPDDLRGRADRWRRIAIEAARQSGRGDAPRIDAPSPLIEALRAIGPSNGACLAPGADRSLGDRLRALGPSDPFTFAVGPEGGFSPQEIAACESIGLVAAEMGSLVLRTETVCAAVLGALLILGSRPSGSC